MSRSEGSTDDSEPISRNYQSRLEHVAAILTVSLECEQEATSLRATMKHILDKIGEWRHQPVDARSIDDFEGEQAFLREQGGHILRLALQQLKETEEQRTQQEAHGQMLKDILLKIAPGISQTPTYSPPTDTRILVFECQCQSAVARTFSHTGGKKIMRTLRQNFIQFRSDVHAESLRRQFDVAPSSHPSHVDVASFSHRFRIGFFRNSKFFGFHVNARYFDLQVWVWCFILFEPILSERTHLPRLTTKVSRGSTAQDPTQKRIDEMERKLGQRIYEMERKLDHACKLASDIGFVICRPTGCECKGALYGIFEKLPGVDPVVKEIYRICPICESYSTTACQTGQ